MVPMRSVPHRVVCLVGLDDGVFPRTDRVDGDDVLARARSPASATRAARTASSSSTRCSPPTETLVITYTGANEHSGAARPPAVPLGEILDAADRTTPSRCASTCWCATRSSPTTPATSRRAVSWATGPFSFDRGGPGRGAGRVGGARPRRRRSSTGRWPPAPAGDVSLADLKAFFAHPVRSFLRGSGSTSRAPLEPDEV